QSGAFYPRPTGLIRNQAQTPAPAIRLTCVPQGRSKRMEFTRGRGDPREMRELMPSGVLLHLTAERCGGCPFFIQAETGSRRQLRRYFRRSQKTRIVHPHLSGTKSVSKPAD